MAERRRPILRVGLTGGIASGKTTVGRILAGLGAFVLDADAIAHEQLRAGTPARERIVERFGAEILDPDGSVSRARLGAVVFGDAAARADLEAILHPAVRDEIDRRIAEYLRHGRSPVAVVDAALLVETGRHRDYERLIVVRCSRGMQVHRLLARDRLSLAQAHARIEAQAPLEVKLAVADYVIDGEGTLRQTREQAERVWAALLQDFAALHGEGGA